MCKKLIFSILFIAFATNTFAQKEFTILYLIPFESESYEGVSPKEPEDMERVKSYGLMGFWNGSQMALEEYGGKHDVSLRAVVRDISNNEAKLRNIMEDRTLMDEVDLIIGPFFSKQFYVAAQYAKQYNIPIVNPFTNRPDIVEDNEYVFKLVASPDVKPAMISFLAGQTNSFPIVVYGDSNSMNREWKSCKKYFAENNIPYYASANSSDVLAKINPEKKNFLLCFDDNAARSLIISRSLVFSKNDADVSFIVPETWLDSKTYDIEYYTQLNLHFFSNYYIDFESEKTKVFMYDYTHRFGIPPSLKNFAFQGYDVTRFFIEYLINDKDIDRVKIEPVAFPLSFDKIPDGGYENVNLQFLEIIDNEIVPCVN